MRVPTSDRVHRELESGEPVVVRIDHDLELVRRPAHVAPGERGHDAVWMRVEGAHEHIEVALVVRRLELGAEARRLPLVRLELEKLRGRRCALPDRIVLAPVDHRRPVGADRRRRGDVRPRALLRRERARGKRGAESRGHDGRTHGITCRERKASGVGHREPGGGWHCVEISALPPDGQAKVLNGTRWARCSPALGADRYRSACTRSPPPARDEDRRRKVRRTRPHLA